MRAAPSRQQRRHCQLRRRVTDRERDGERVRRREGGGGEGGEREREGKREGKREAERGGGGREIFRCRKLSHFSG